jgi:hypothetical protein
VSERRSQRRRIESAHVNVRYWHKADMETPLGMSVFGVQQTPIFVLRKELGPPRQPQEGTVDCDKQKNSQDSAAEEQIHAFLRSQYLSHANYNGPKRRIVHQNGDRATTR